MKKVIIIGHGRSSREIRCELLRHYRMLAELKMISGSFIATTKNLATQLDEIGRASELAGHKICKIFIDEGIAGLSLSDKLKHTPEHIRQQHKYAIRYHGRR